MSNTSDPKIDTENWIEEVSLPESLYPVIQAEQGALELETNSVAFSHETGAESDDSMYLKLKRPSDDELALRVIYRGDRLDTFVISHSILLKRAGHLKRAISRSENGERLPGDQYVSHHGFGLAMSADLHAGVDTSGDGEERVETTISPCIGPTPECVSIEMRVRTPDIDHFSGEVQLNVEQAESVRSAIEAHVDDYESDGESRIVADGGRCDEAGRTA